MFTLLRRLRARLKYRHFERDLARELEIHRAMAQQDLEARGLSTADARPAAAKALGNTTYMREEARSVWISRWMEATWQDVRYALTAFRRQPVFGVGAIVMLGIGLGLVATVFTFAEASFFRPWRVPNPDTLFLVRSSTTGGALGGDFGAVSMPEYRYLRAHATTIQLAVTTPVAAGQATYADGTHERLEALGVSAGYFEALGIPLVAGRTFLRGEDSSPTPSNVVIISERVWTERFGRTPDIAGRPLLLGKTMYTVVGVTPVRFMDGSGSLTELWRVMNLAQYPDPRHRDFPRNFIGRLAPGASVDRALTELTDLSRQFRATTQLPGIGFRLLDTRPVSRGLNDAAQVVGFLFLALVIVQLVACANVGNLMLARAMGRQREIAVRLSLGAGRTRIVRQLLTESLVLAAAAGILGLTITMLVPRVLVATVPDLGQRAEYYAPSWMTVVMVGVMSAATALACGLTPALRTTRVSLAVVIGERHGHTIQIARMGRFLLASQVALATVLLLSAGLLTRAVNHASQVDPGFDVDAVTEVTLEFPAGTPLDQRRPVQHGLWEAARQANLPPLALSDSAPVEDNRYSDWLRTTQSERIRSVAAKNVTENYFEVIGLSLIAGRGPSSSNGIREVVLSKSVADSMWPGENPLGKVVYSGARFEDADAKVVVGIAPEVSVRSVSGTQPAAYSGTEHGVTLALVRSTDPEILERITAIVGALNPAVRVSFRPVRDSLAETLTVARIAGWVSWGIGGVGLLLATIGAFGVFAHAVEAKRREIGVRMALGAQAAQVVRSVLTATQRPVVVGLGAGVILAAISTRLFSSYLYGMSPYDPLAYLQVVSLLFSAAMLATWIPARRATRIKPAETLRSE
jgi:predicted permease